MAQRLWLLLQRGPSKRSSASLLWKWLLLLQPLMLSHLMARCHRGGSSSSGGRCRLAPA
jgi:hypothetical protein